MEPGNRTSLQGHRVRGSCGNGWHAQDHRRKEQELKTRFAPVFMKQIKSYGQQIFAPKEIEAAKAGGAFVVRQVADGGILAALWNLALELNQGLDLDMKKISILQETIEVCEHFRLNPYQMISTGSFLAVTDNGEVLADALNNQGLQQQ